MSGATEEAMAAGRQSQCAADLTTRSGARLHARTAQASDTGLLSDLFRHVSAEDLRFRFMDTAGELSAGQLAALVDADHGVTTFLALCGDGCAVACCTLTEDKDGQSADVTLSVRSDWKGKGVSWTLLEYVLGCAAARGLKRVSSLESGEDRAAINLQREMGFVARLHSADPMEYTLSKFVEPQPGS